MVAEQLLLPYLQAAAGVPKAKKAAANPDRLLLPLVPAADARAVLKAAVLHLLPVL